jgi:hypothetical protein
MGPPVRPADRATGRSIGAPGIAPMSLRRRQRPALSRVGVCRSPMYRACIGAVSAGQ